MYQSIPALLEIVCGHDRPWFESLSTRRVRANASSNQLRQSLGAPVPDDGMPPDAVIAVPISLTVNTPRRKSLELGFVVAFCERIGVR